MENYDVKKKLGKGAQGSVFLVEDKFTNEMCVVKKVECSDETEANKAFKEAVALQNLNHPYICGYREFFVIWEQENCAIYVCIVMDYYKLGDLDQTLRNKRKIKEMLEEAVLRKWVGQMVEALVYVHEKNIIHRDLKPSNIFLKDDLSISIGDFGVATVMGNIRTITRTAVGSISWMAPEILEMPPHYDERSDVWSFGCIVLEMATCGIKNVRETAVLLFELKDNPQVLEEILLPVEEHYGPDLCQLIRVTLRRGFQQRPSSRDLIELPYIQSCLGLSGSHLYKNLNAADVGGCEVVKAVPTSGGVEPVIEYMQGSQKSQECQILALKQLLKLNNVKAGAALKKQVLASMTSFKASLEIQTLGCHILATIATTADLQDGDILFSKDFIQPICAALRSHAGSKSLYTWATTFLMGLSSDESAAAIIGEMGGVQDILLAMRSFPNDIEIVSNACRSIWALSLNEKNLKILTTEKGVMDIYNAMVAFKDSNIVMDAACSSMWSLSVEDENLNVMASLCMVDVLLQIIEKHVEDANIVKCTCSALCSLAEVHELSAYHVIHTEGGLNGIPILKNAIDFHSTNDEVVEGIASLFSSLSYYNDIREEMNSLNVPATLVKLGEAFFNSGDKETSSVIAKALESLVLSDKS